MTNGEIMLAGTARLLAREISQRQVKGLEEFFAEIAGGAVPPDIIRKAISRMERGRLVGVSDGRVHLALIPFEINPDGSAQVGVPLFHPHAARRESDVISAAADAVVSLGARTVHIALPEESSLAPFFLKAGFKSGPLMLEMAGGVPAVSAPPECKWIPYRARDRRLFADVFYRTLEGSLDFPELPVSMDGAKVMRAFEMRGVHNNDDFAGLDVGGNMCGLIFVVSQGPRVEIVYMGLVPAERGKGLGKALVARAAERARAHNASEIQLTVDSRNVPAIAAYRKFGLSEKRAVRVYYRVEKKS
jgi:GNAT superfamily N-acetyltransferase